VTGAFLDRLGDRVNPVTVKETRQAVGSRLVSGALLLFLAGQFVAVALMTAGREETSAAAEVDLRAGRDVFLTVQVILLGTCMLLVPALTGSRLGTERSDTNTDLLFISALSPWAVVAGKLAAAAALILLIFSACAPFMAFAYLLRGLDVPTILVVLAIDFVAVLAGTMFALLTAAFPVNKGFRGLLGLGAFGVLVYAFAGAMAATAAILESRLGVDVGAWDFWAGFAGLAALILGVTGLMFVWAVALLTPPTANRAVIPRAYTLVFWLATGAGCLAWNRYVTEPGPVFVWGFVGVALAVLQLAVSVSERDAWGPRVARRIPRNPLMRWPAFFFFSGAAGGLLFATGLGVLSVAGMGAWVEARWPGVTVPAHREPPRVAGLAFGYAYCYALTAVLFRRAMPRGAFKPEYTWVVGLCLFALGCVLPLVAEASLYTRQSRGLYRDELLWLHLPNPFVVLDRATRTTGDKIVGLAAVFLAAWAAAVTLLNARWLFRQAAGFRPPARTASPEDLPAPTGRP
jgi:hypothetical protein